ncbi:MAG TPA: hypothetical protein VFH90_03650 [Candidatus Limnocylindria bacterium]|nr:hypothetical protein [Candidatus Limnocylindria bacterium]
MSELAHLYCSAIDARASLTADDLVSRVHPLLAEIHLPALALPWPDVEYAEFETPVADRELCQDLDAFHAFHAWRFEGAAG